MKKPNQIIGGIVTLLAGILFCIFMFGNHGFSQEAVYHEAILALTFMCFGVGVMTLRVFPMILAIVCLIILFILL